MFPATLSSNSSKEPHKACKPQFGDVCYICLVVIAIKTIIKFNYIDLLTK
jgi:hypothetical protein